MANALQNEQAITLVCVWWVRCVELFASNGFPFDIYRFMVWFKCLTPLYVWLFHGKVSNWKLELEPLLKFRRSVLFHSIRMQMSNDTETTTEEEERKKNRERDEKK